MMSDFLAYFLTYLPTPVRFFPNIDFLFYHMVSDFGKSTNLPKNWTWLMDIPLDEMNEYISRFFFHLFLIIIMNLII